MCPGIGAALASAYAAATVSTATTLASAAIASSLISGGVNMAQQRANMKAQEKYQAQRFEANKRLAAEAAQSQYGQIQLRETQERAASSQQIEEAARRRMQVEATATTAAGEGGAMGQSFDAILQEYSRQEGAYQSSIMSNFGGRRMVLGDQLDAVRIGEQGSVQQMLPQPTARPNYFEQALSIAGQSLGIASSVEWS